MDPTNKLHPDEKHNLATKFPTLDAILRQRRDIQAEVRTLSAKIEELRKLDQELDEKFHREALIVMPTVTKKLPERKRAAQGSQETNILVQEILKALEAKGPSKEEQLQQILNRFGK